MAHGTPKSKRHPLPPVHIVWGTVDMQKMTELIGDAVRMMAAKGLVHQGNRQLFAGWIRHHTCQTCGLFLFSRGLLLPGCAQQPLCQCHRLLRQVVACGTARWAWLSVHVRGLDSHRCYSYAVPSILALSLQDYPEAERPFAGQHRTRHMNRATRR